MADPATQQLKIQIKTVGQAGLSKLASSLRGINGIAKQSKIDFGSINKQLNNTNKTMIRSANNVKKLRDAFEEQARSLDRTTKEFKDATQAAKQLDKELAKMEGRRRSGGGLRGAAQTIGTVAGAGVFGGFEGAAGALLGAGLGGPAGAVVGGAIGAQVGQVRQALGATAEYASEITKLRIALEGVTQGTGEYNQALKIISQSTKDFAIPQSVLTRQFTRLQAAVEGAGGNVADTELAFRGIVAAVRATGGSLQDVDSALTATAQVFSKGKVSAEELRQQIGERLPGAFSLFAESIGLTPQELDKALERGQVSLQDFQKFAELLFKRYGETAKEIADGPEGAGDRLKVALEELNESVGELLQPIGAAFQETFKTIVDAITDGIDALNRFNRANAEKAARAYREEAARLPEGSRAQQYAIALAEEAERRAGFTGGLVGPEVPSRLRRSELPGITQGGNKSATGRVDMSADLSEAKVAVLYAANKQRELELEFEARLIEIRDAGYKQEERYYQLQLALSNLRKGRARIEEKEAKQSEKRAKQIKAEYEALRKALLGFRAGGYGVEGQAPKQQKTPFDALKEGADSFVDSLGTALEATKKLGEVGIKGLGDAITELVVNGTLNFREFAASLLRDMARIIMQQLVVKSLMELIGFGTSATTSTDWTKFSVDTKGLVGPKFAKGGITSGPSIAGEAGPEAVVPLPDGRSIPVTMTGGAGNIVVNVDAGGTKAEGDDEKSRRLGEVIGAAVKQELIQQKRPGGLLY